MAKGDKKGVPLPFFTQLFVYYTKFRTKPARGVGHRKDDSSHSRQASAARPRFGDALRGGNEAYK